MFDRTISVNKKVYKKKVEIISDSNRLSNDVTRYNGLIASLLAHLYIVIHVYCRKSIVMGFCLHPSGCKSDHSPWCILMFLIIIFFSFIYNNPLPQANILLGPQDPVSHTGMNSAAAGSSTGFAPAENNADRGSSPAVPHQKHQSLKEEVCTSVYQVKLRRSGWERSWKELTCCGKLSSHSDRLGSAHCWSETAWTHDCYWNSKGFSGTFPKFSSKLIVVQL